MMTTGVEIQMTADCQTMTVSVPVHSSWDKFGLWGRENMSYPFPTPTQPKAASPGQSVSEQGFVGLREATNCWI